jgi:hypothetical protein
VTLVDSNVLLDIFGKTPIWWEWSLARLEEASSRGPLLINDVIFAETSIRFQTIADFDAALLEAAITVAPIPRMALFHSFRPVPQLGRCPLRRTAGFLHRGSCGGRRPAAIDPRYPPLSKLLSDC